MHKANEQWQPLNGQAASILNSIRLFYWLCQPYSALTALFLCAKGFQAILLSAHVGRSVTILYDY